MIGYIGRNCKLRCLVFSVTDGIIKSIQTKPGGYTFWHSLPKHGTDNTEAFRKKIAETLLSSLYDSSFMMMLLQAALDQNGKPLLHSPLYRWLLSNVYSENVQKLYQDWSEVGRKS